MKVKVILENQPPLYPGTLLKGKLTCDVSSRTQIRAVKVRCYGKEYTEFRESGSNFFTTHYFFQMETKLFEPEDGVMNSGFYTYPFTFLLPISLPSTFEFPFGYVRFSVKGLVDIPLAVDPTDRLDLALISILDIKSFPESLKQPYQIRNEGTMGCCLLSFGEPLTFEAQINKRLLIVGETMRINIEINNTTNDNLEEVIVKLVRSLVAHSDKPGHHSQYINEDLVSRKFSGVNANRMQTYDVDLCIPSDLSVPNLVGCQLLESVYRVEVVGITSGCKNLNFVVAEISIGHVDEPGWTGATSTCVPYGSAGRQLGTPNSVYPHPVDGKGSIGFGTPHPSAPPLTKKRMESVK